MENQYQDELNQNRKADAEKATAAAPAEHVSFPWGMFFVALIFDIVGIIPLLNLFTEALAGLIFWFWQKSYTPTLDPLLNLFVNKIIDFFSLGLYPSNIGFVIISYIKKKAHSKAASPIVQRATGRLAGQSAT